MAGEAQVVKLCSIAETIPACDLTDPTNPVQIFAHVVHDANSQLIPFGDATYAAPPGWVGDGSGFVNSYFADASGAPLAAQPDPAVVSYGGECGLGEIDVEIGCVVNPTDPTVAPVPVVATTEVAVDGTVTVVYTSLLDGTVVAVAAPLEFRPDCNQFDIEEYEGCIRDAAGAIVGRATRVRVYDNEAPDPDAIVAENYYDSTGAPIVLGADQTFGSCDCFEPLVYPGCLEGPAGVYTSTRQVIPVIDCVPDYAAATYIDPLTGADLGITPVAFIDGPCGVPCVTCP